MKFAIAEEHRRYFQKNGMIEFERVFGEADANQVRREVLISLSKRLSNQGVDISKENPNRVFEAGRDLWRENDTVRKKVCQRNLGELVFALSDVRPVRIGYDQYFPAVPSNIDTLPGKYTEFLKTPTSLKEASSLQGIVCGILFSLGDTGAAEPTEKGFPFPDGAGNALFLHPETPIPWHALFPEWEMDYYLVVYTLEKCLFFLNERDPLSRSFMKAGYGTGDLLKNDKNPLIYR